jgi:hypothetical protein
MISILIIYGNDDPVRITVYEQLTKGRHKRGLVKQYITLQRQNYYRLTLHEGIFRSHEQMPDQIDYGWVDTIMGCTGDKGWYNSIENSRNNIPHCTYLVEVEP